MVGRAVEFRKGRKGKRVRSQRGRSSESVNWTNYSNYWKFRCGLWGSETDRTVIRYHDEHTLATAATAVAVAIAVVIADADADALAFSHFPPLTPRTPTPHTNTHSTPTARDMTQSRVLAMTRTRGYLRLDTLVFVFNPSVSPHTLWPSHFSLPRSPSTLSTSIRSSRTRKWLWSN